MYRAFRRLQDRLASKITSIQFRQAEFVVSIFFAFCKTMLIMSASYTGMMIGFSLSGKDLGSFFWFYLGVLALPFVMAFGSYVFFRIKNSRSAVKATN